MYAKSSLAYYYIKQFTFEFYFMCIVIHIEYHHKNIHLANISFILKTGSARSTTLHGPMKCVINGWNLKIMQYMKQIGATPCCDWLYSAQIALVLTFQAYHSITMIANISIGLKNTALYYFIDWNLNWYSNETFFFPIITWKRKV